MKLILIISASVRQSRRSHRVALFFQKQLSRLAETRAELFDLKEKNFPVFHERLAYMADPAPELLTASEQVRSADAIIIVTPEYNGGYPASLKNFTDLLYNEWKRKPLAIVTVSDGQFGGTQVLTSLSFSFFKIGAFLVPAMFPCPKVQDLFDEEGNPLDDGKTLKRADKFIKEIFWCIKAKSAADADSSEPEDVY